MQQVRTFLLPDQEQEANEFLAKTKVDKLNFNTNMVVAFYEDGTTPVSYRIACLNERVIANKDACFDFEVALHMMELEQADLNPKHNKNKYDELANAIHETKKQLDQHDAKREYAEARIKELQASE